MAHMGRVYHTSCLKALKVDCDLVDVAGMSGYAFHLGINKGLCPSGPTWLDWNKLIWGVHLLGRSILVFETGECYMDKSRNERTNSQGKAAFELVKTEIENGRPCVIWGAYIPEFAVVVGIEGNSYIVKSYRECIDQPQPPIPFDELEAPGGLYVLAFPTKTNVTVFNKDRFILENALFFFKHRPSHTMRYGKDGYDYWISELESGNADSFGSGYNTACYHEGRGFAKEFLVRVAKRNEFTRDDLIKASKLYADAEKAFGKLVKLFPFPGEMGKKITDKKVVSDAVEALKKAKKAECKAIDIIEDVVEMDWPK